MSYLSELSFVVTKNPNLDRGGHRSAAVTAPPESGQGAMPDHPPDRANSVMLYRIEPPRATGQSRREDLRAWTGPERDLLRTLHAQHLSNDEIAGRLNRTGEAVSNMSRRLGLRRRDTAQPWTDAQLTTLERLLESGCSLKQIAESTGHPRSSVADKLRRLKVKSRRFRQPWTDEERQTVLKLHAAGASLSAIAEAVPARSLDAVQQKLQELIGPAPFRSNQRARMATAVAVKAKAERPAPPRPPAPVVKSTLAIQPSPARAAVLLIRERREAQPITASTDDMIRWLRSRDFMVIHRTPGWQVDRHQLADEQELLDFVNTRRLRLNLPQFTRAGSTGYAPRVVTDAAGCAAAAS